MKNKTRELKNKIQTVNSLEEKLAILKNQYQKEECYIITAGPSFKKIPLKVLKKKLKDKLVIMVKQTYGVAPEIGDFHLLNSWNYTPYDYTKNPNTIVLMEKTENDPATPGLQEDLLFNVGGVAKHIPREKRLANRLAQKKNFEDYLFENQLDRPWGPGIVYELGIYLALHLGVSKIITIGWDIGEIGAKTMEHFYDTKKPQLLDNPKNLLSKDSTQTISFFEKIKSKLFKKVVIFNEPGFFEGEVELISESTKDLYFWLKEKGVELHVVSDQSAVDQIVPRIQL